MLSVSLNVIMEQSAVEVHLKKTALVLFFFELSQESEMKL